MYSRLLLIFLLFVSTVCTAKQRHVYFSLGDFAVLPSISYERNFENNYWAGVSFGYLPLYKEGVVHLMTMPVFVRKTWFGEKHSFETSAAVVFGGVAYRVMDHPTLNIAKLFYSGSVGYRYTANKFVFRAVCSPMLFHNREVIPMFGISLGYKN